MPRKPRFFVSDIPVHIVQRGNNREAIFFDEEDYRAYLNWLKEGASRYGCAIHAYVLMTNHTHILVTPSTRESVSRLLQYVGRRYVPYVNHQYGRSGTLWEGRFKASLIEAETYLLACYRYIELNPVRAGMVASPGEYVWSSYRANALGYNDSLLTGHPLYLALGADAETRQARYRALFEAHLADHLLTDVRNCLNTGTPLGNDRFRSQIEAVLKMKVGQSRRGRPCKAADV